MDERAVAQAQSGTAAPLFDVGVSPDGQFVVVTLADEHDLASEAGLPRVIAVATGAGAPVRIDIGNVAFLDSSVLRNLLIWQARLASAGVDVKVRNATDQARQIFEMTSLTSLLEERPYGS